MQVIFSYPFRNNDFISAKIAKTTFLHHQWLKDLWLRTMVKRCSLGTQWPHCLGKQVSNLQTLTHPPLLQIQLHSLMPSSAADHLLWPLLPLCPQWQRITQVFSYSLCHHPIHYLIHQTLHSVPGKSAAREVDNLGKPADHLQTFTLPLHLQTQSPRLIPNSVVDYQLWPFPYLCLHSQGTM